MQSHWGSMGSFTDAIAWGAKCTGDYTSAATVPPPHSEVSDFIQVLGGWSCDCMGNRVHRGLSICGISVPSPPRGVGLYLRPRKVELLVAVP